MELKYVLLADAANTTSEGKLNVLGVFEAIGARQFPVVHPHMTLVGAFGIRPVDVGKTRNVAIRLLTYDGIEVLKVEMAFNIPPTPLPEPQPTFYSIAAVNGVQFENPGRYEFYLEVDGHVEGSATLSVVKVD